MSFFCAVRQCGPVLQIAFTFCSPYLPYHEFGPRSVSGPPFGNVEPCSGDRAGFVVWRLDTCKHESWRYKRPMTTRSPWTWQVMFGPRRMLRKPGDSGRQEVRHFEDERAAREFARRMVQAGHTVQAGTKPGVEPAQKVLPAEVDAWCAEKD